MIDWLSAIDDSLLLAANGYHSAAGDSLMSLLTGKIIWAPFYIYCIYLIHRNFSTKQTVIFTLSILMGVVVVNWLCHDIVRELLPRLRPSNPLNPISEHINIVNDMRGGKYSFPSCHAANSFVLATSMWLILKRRWISSLLIFWAILNSYTRLYLGLHYPSDLIAGALIGIAGGYAAVLAGKYIIERAERYNTLDLIRWKSLKKRILNRQ